MKRSKVLLIDSSAVSRALLTGHLDNNGYEVSSFADGPEAIENVKQQGLPDIALVNIYLATMHGFQVAIALRSMADVPIIFLTEFGDDDFVVEGVGKYAEDFISPPYDLRELEARIHIVLTRMPRFNYTSEPLIEIDGHLSIDFARSRIVVGGRVVGLTPIESTLLLLLLRNTTRVVENSTFLARVWPSGDVFEDTLRVHMHRLRRKLESDSHHPHYIHTERGVGYRFTQQPPLVEETV